MKFYRCDLCGIEVKGVFNLQLIDICGYASFPGLIYDHNDACGECAKRVKEYIDALKVEYLLDHKRKDRLKD